MFGSNLHSDNFMKKMGQNGLHPFVNGFKAHGIHKFSQLKCEPIAKIDEIAQAINMPPPAVDRLLGILGKKREGSSSSKNPTTAPVQSKPKTTAPRPKKVTETPAPVKKESRPSKVQESSYYHFESTPDHMARQFDAKKVSDPTDAIWQTAKGASSWNPGNTVESMDFSDQAQQFTKIKLTDLILTDGVKVSKVKKTSGDFSLISNRGKIKNIYDLAFECEWKGKIGDEKVAGKLEISDIMPDDDDWYIQCSPKKRDTAHQLAKKLILADLVNKLNALIFEPMVREIRAHVGH